MRDKRPPSASSSRWVARETHTLRRAIRRGDEREDDPLSACIECSLYEYLITSRNSHPRRARSPCSARDHGMQVFGADRTMLLIDHEHIGTSCGEGLGND